MTVHCLQIVSVVLTYRAVVSQNTHVVAVVLADNVAVALVL